MSEDRVCRTCLRTTSNCISIFKEPALWGKTIPLSKMIMACAPVNILQGDGFPSYICESCLKQLQLTFLFRMRILESDEQLKACEKRQVKPNIQSEEASTTPYLVQHANESVYSLKEILESSEHNEKASKNTRAINSSGTPCKNKRLMSEMNSLLKPIEEVNVPMLSDILYEETVDTTVLPSVKNSKYPPKTIGQVDLTDDKTDINLTVPHLKLPEKQSDNPQNISNNIIVHPLQITNQLLLPSNYNLCVSENAQFQTDQNNLIQLQDSDKSILHNLLQSQNQSKIDNHYIVIAGNSGANQYLVAPNPNVQQQNNEQHYNRTNNLSDEVRFAPQLNQQNVPLERNRSELAVAPHKNQRNTLNQIRTNSTQQSQTNLKAYENNYYNFLNADEKQKVNELLSTKRTNPKRNSTESDCVDLTSDVEDEFTNANDSDVKITHVSSQVNKKMCFKKK